MGVDLKYHNIELIDATDLLVDTIIPDWIDYMHEYSHDSLNKSTKLKFFYHFFIKNVCDTLLNNRSSIKKVLFITLRKQNNTNTVLKNRLDAIDCEEEEFFLLVKGLVNKLECNFPLKFYISTYSYEKFMQLHKDGDGLAVYHINTLKIKMEKMSKRQYQYNLVNKFIKKYELVWLDENYFNNMKTKLLSVS